MKNLNVTELDSKELFEVNGGKSLFAIVAIGIIHEAYDFYEGVVSGWDSIEKAE